MQDVEFRGQFPNKKWIYSVSIIDTYYDMKYSKETKYYLPKKNETCRIKTDEKTGDITNINNKFLLVKNVGRYIGIKDMNGKKIFEDDIIRVFDIYTGIRFTGVVEFDNASFLVNQSDRIKHYRWSDYICVVIGNKYDNHELLVSEKQ